MKVGHWIYGFGLLFYQKMYHLCVHEEHENRIYHSVNILCAYSERLFHN